MPGIYLYILSSHLTHYRGLTTTTSRAAVHCLVPKAIHFQNLKSSVALFTIWRKECPQGDDSFIPYCKSTVRHIHTHKYACV